jgi:6-phosphogluconolactonase (cycloisomerase 2 family)
MTAEHARLSISAILVAAVVLLVGSFGMAQQNLVYINLNIGTQHDGNAIAAYVNDGAGNLTPLAGSPFHTGGTGVSGPAASGSGAYDADQQVIVNAAGTLLLAVNGHTNSVASFTINSDGSLTTVAGSPFSSMGKDPASLGLSDGVLGTRGSILTVVNKDADPNQSGGVPGYFDFQLSPTGVMTPMQGTKIALAAGTNPSQAVPDSGLHLVFTDEFKATPATITARRLDKVNGKMATVSTVDAPDGAVVLGDVLHPSQNILYATLAASNGLAVFDFDTSGNLSVANNIPGIGNVICWLAINAAGTRLYTGNNGDGTVTVFDLTDPNNPVDLQLFQLSGTSPHTNNVRVDPSQQFLYALDGENLHVLSISPIDGTLSEPGAPVALPAPGGNIATGIATLLK